MGNSGNTLVVSLDSFIFTQKMTELDSARLSSIEDVERHFSALCKPELSSSNLRFEVWTSNSRRSLTLPNLQECIETGKIAKITAREIGKLMLVVKGFRDSTYLGKTTFFETEDTLVINVKARAKRHFAIHKDVSLYTNTMELDDNMTLSQNGIIEDCRLAVLPKGEPKMLLSGEMQNLIPWRLLKSGLNLEGTCENSSCPAFSQRVVISLGFGEFSIAEELLFHYVCPICNEVVQNFSMLGLFNCSANFDRPSKKSAKIEALDCSTHSYTKTKLENWRSAKVKVEHRGG